MGLIHADLHFGNLLVHQGQLVAIDFDDCGYGFHAYDLAIPLVSLEYYAKLQKSKDMYRNSRAALFAGYRSIERLDVKDEAMVHQLMIARNLFMVTWIHSRSDHPRLQARLKKVVNRVVQVIRRGAWADR